MSHWQRKEQSGKTQKIQPIYWWLYFDIFSGILIISQIHFLFQHFNGLVQIFDLIKSMFPTSSFPGTIDRTLSSESSGIEQIKNT